MAGVKIPPELQAWITARKRFKLSHAQVQMAREVGMNPAKLAKLDNHKQERWKVPLPEFIQICYQRAFGQSSPERIRSIEEMVAAKAEKKAFRRERRAARGSYNTSTAPGGRSESNESPSETGTELN